MRKSVALLLLWSLACTQEEGADPSSPDAAAASDAAPADAAPADAGPVQAAACGGRALVFSRSEAEVTATLEALLAGVRARQPDAYYREAVDGTRRQAVLTGLRAELAAAADEDPRPAAIAWLAAAAPQTLVAAEWTIDPLQDAIDPRAIAQGDVLIGGVARASVDGIPWPLEYPARWVEGGGVGLIVEKTAEGWELRQATLVPATAFATRADAELLAGCEPATPGPEEPLRAHRFDGWEFEGCVHVGDYSYVPAAGDTTSWGAGLGFALGAVVDGRARWHAFRAVELVIAEDNYWPRIAYADCLCHGLAGFTLRVDAVTGEVLRYVPGVRYCTVC